MINGFQRQTCYPMRLTGCTRKRLSYIDDLRMEGKYQNMNTLSKCSDLVAGSRNEIGVASFELHAINICVRTCLKCEKWIYKASPKPHSRTLFNLSITSIPSQTPPRTNKQTSNPKPKTLAKMQFSKIFLVVAGFAATAFAGCHVGYPGSPLKHSLDWSCMCAISLVKKADFTWYIRTKATR